MNMSADDTTQQLLSTGLEDQCQISEKPSPGTPTNTMPTKKQYRPRATSLPTSLVRTITLQQEDGNNDEGVPTTIILRLFSDRIFLSTTQIAGKMGSLLVCNVEESIIDNSTTGSITREELAQSRELRLRGLP